YEMPILGSVNNDDLIRSVVTHLAKTKLTLVDKPLQAIFDIVKASSMPGAALPTDDEQSRTWLRDKYPDPCDLPGRDQQERSFKALHLSAGVLSLSNAGMKASVATRCILKERLFETETRLHLDS